MTLIVGVWCTDGVVVGSDSAVTFSTATHLPTIVQHFPRKIAIINDRVAIAGTGSVGLGQRFIEVVEKAWRQGSFKDAGSLDVARTIAREARKDFGSTGASEGKYGALVALPRGQNHPLLIEFPVDDLQPHVKDKDSWYVSMGSGQAVADPLLGFVREAFWGNKPPRLREAIFSVAFVLLLACEMVPQGVRPPIQMVVLERARKNMEARYLGEVELGEHHDHFVRFMAYVNEFRHERAPGDAPPPAPSQRS